MINNIGNIHTIKSNNDDVNGFMKCDLDCRFT